MAIRTANANHELFHLQNLQAIVFFIALGVLPVKKIMYFFLITQRLSACNFCVVQMRLMKKMLAKLVKCEEKKWRARRKKNESE